MCCWMCLPKIADGVQRVFSKNSVKLHGTKFEILKYYPTDPIIVLYVLCVM